MPDVRTVPTTEPKVVEKPWYEPKELCPSQKADVYTEVKRALD